MKKGGFDKGMAIVVRQVLEWFLQLPWLLKLFVVVVGGGYFLAPDFVPGPLDDMIVIIFTLVAAYVGDVILDVFLPQDE